MDMVLPVIERLVFSCCAAATTSAIVWVSSFKVSVSILNVSLTNRGRSLLRYREVFCHDLLRACIPETVDPGV